MLENPLGKTLEFPHHYAPELLFPIARAESRAAFIDPGRLPFCGEDVWNAWELCWLDTDARPAVATAEIRVPADSDNLIESKSLKLYLNSHANERYESATALGEIIAADLSQAAGGSVSVSIDTDVAGANRLCSDLPGECIDAAPFAAADKAACADYLAVRQEGSTDESLQTHLFRSLCPVTGQPDNGSVLVRYRGAPVDRASLLRYLCSYRNHNAFHEDCVERIFVDILERCAPEQLTVAAFFCRRGGIDINPFRSRTAASAGNPRLWRQ